MLKKITLASALCALAIPFAALAAGPTGFSGQERPGAPQGFTHEKMASIAQLKDKAKDDQIVVLEGRFTKQLEKDPATVSKWCTNTSQPSLDTLLKISQILEVDIRELLISSK